VIRSVNLYSLKRRWGVWILTMTETLNICQAMGDGLSVPCFSFRINKIDR